MLLDMLFGYMATQCLYVVVKLGIADYLIAGEQNINELAELSGCDHDALYRILRYLANEGIFIEKHDKVFMLNDQANLLLSSNPKGMCSFILICGEEFYQCAGDLLFTVKNGKPAFDHQFKTDFWKYLGQNPDKAELFNSAMEKGFNNTIKSIIKAYDFSSSIKLIDVGGGKGQLVCTILKEINNNTLGIVYDLEHCEVSAKKYIESNNLSERCKFIKGDFFQKVPKGGDLYLLRVVLHDWDDDAAIKILENCRKSMNNNGKIIIIEKVIMDNNYKTSTYLGDIHMLLSLTGKERSVDEYEALLNKSGFQLRRFITTNTPYSIIEGSPIGFEVQ
jgi:ubiquinone/menaquinone biosynthesis C-methylase UbiE